MADESISREVFQPRTPSLSDAVVRGKPATAVDASAQPKGAPLDVQLPHRAEFHQLVAWLAGLVLMLAAGWGFIALCFYLENRLALKLSLTTLLIVAIGISFVFFLLLQRNLWLCRLMHLHTIGWSTQFTEAVFFCILGPVGLMFRTSAGEKPGLAKPPQKNDGMREIVETVVFVIVLVVLLRTYLVEAFVIPTGSMATTLLGHHKVITCRQCGYTFLVNCSMEVDPDPQRGKVDVLGGCCRNCLYENKLP